MNIGTALKEIRKSKGLRQNKSAIEIGITQTYLSQIESNDKTPSLEVIEKIGKYYQVPVAILLWKGVEQSDISVSKQEAFAYIKPLVDQLINQIF